MSRAKPNFNRIIFIVLGAVLVLGAINAAIVRMELRIRDGRTVYLELAPRDPRSLMQGDYMVLNYALNEGDWVRGLRGAGTPPRGTLVAKVDRRGVATFDRLKEGAAPLAPDELRLRYRHDGWRIQTAPEAYFFQEGRAEHFEAARFGQVRVSRDGVAILTGLADETFRLLN